MALIVDQVGIGANVHGVLFRTFKPIKAQTVKVFHGYESLEHQKLESKCHISLYISQ